MPEDEKKLDRESAAAEKSLDKLTDKVLTLSLSQHGTPPGCLSDRSSGDPSHARTRQVEEKELDADKVQQAMSAIAAAQQADKAAQHLRRVFSVQGTLPCIGAYWISYRPNPLRNEHRFIDSISVRRRRVKEGVLDSVRTSRRLGMIAEMNAGKRSWQPSGSAQRTWR